VNGDHQISQSEADNFRSQVDGALYASATSYNAAGGVASEPPVRAKALASAMDANGDHQISQNEADDFRSQVDSTLLAAATSYNAGGMAGEPTDPAKAIASAMDVNGDHQISQNEGDDFRSRVDSTLYAAATAYNADGPTGSGNGSSSSPPSQDRKETSALGNFVVSEYSQAASNFTPPSQTLSVAA
jgi:hypothetical protein